MLIGQGDIWRTLGEWRANNQKWNNLPRWQVDQFAEVPADVHNRPGQALVWLGRNLMTLGIWLQNRYGDSCLIEPEPGPQVETSNG